MIVRYLGDEGVSGSQLTYAGTDDPRGLLEDGKRYEVQLYDVHAWYTKVTLASFPNKRFNSVHFEICGDREEPVAKPQEQKITELIHTLNGTPLNIGQAMTLRVALESFASSLVSEGLGDDEIGRGMVKGYLARIEELREIIYKGK